MTYIRKNYIIINNIMQYEIHSGISITKFKVNCKVAKFEVIICSTFEVIICIEDMGLVGLWGYIQRVEISFFS